MSRFAYDNWQQYVFLGERTKWPPPATDVRRGVVKQDTTRVGDRTRTAIDWPETNVGSIGFPAATPKPWDGRLFMGGHPIQRADPNGVMVNITERNTYKGTVRNRWMPRQQYPGAPWIQGNPNQGGGYDRHTVVVIEEDTFYGQPDTGKWWPAGSWWECIGRRGNDCLVMGEFDPDGNLIDGGFTTKAQSGMVPRLLWPDDEPHRMSLVLREYAAGRFNGEADGHGEYDAPRVNDWLAVPASVAADIPVNSVHEERALWAAVEYGFIVMDISGHNAVASVSTNEWTAETSLAGLDIPMEALERVEYRPLEYVGPFYPAVHPLFNYDDETLWADPWQDGSPGTGGPPEVDPATLVRLQTNEGPWGSLST